MRSLVWTVVAAVAFSVVSNGCDSSKPDMASQNADKSGPKQPSNAEVKTGAGDKNKKGMPPPPRLLPPPP
jgi:hypothetical protein